MKRTLFFSGILVLALATFVGIQILRVDREVSTTRYGEDRGGKAVGQKPNEWFFTQRAYPLGDIPMDRYRAAVEEAKAQRALLEEYGHRSGTGVGTWVAVGPANIGGRVTALDVHPDVPDRFFIGGAFGGVLRSTDGGSSWTPLMDEEPSLSIGALTIHPDDPDHIYVGTGEANASGDSYPGTGLYESTDVGDTWSFVGLPNSRHINRIAVHPQNTDLIFVAVMGGLYSAGPDRGCYRSTDGGATWDQVLFVSDSTGCNDVVVHPDDPNIVYAAMWERMRGPGYRNVGGYTSGIYRSTDGGDVWDFIGSGLPVPGADVGRIGLAICESAPNVLYAIFADDPGFFDGLYKSTNGGDTWSRVNDGALSDLYYSFGWYFGNVRVDPQNPDRVYAMGLDTYRSTNGGTSWSNITYPVHVDQHDWWISPTNGNWMLSGHDGGVDRTTNGGSSWTKFYDLPITQFYAACCDPQQPWRLYGGTQDNGTMRTPGGLLDDWEIILGGDGFYCIVDPTNSNTIYAEWQWGNLMKSTDGGDDFNDATNGIPSSERRNWSTPVVMDPSDNETLYYGTYKVYRTTNGAGSWSAISPDLSDGPGSGNLTFGTMTTLAVAPSDPQVIYAGLDDGNVWVTTNGGGNWTKISNPLPDRWITRVAVDPDDARTAYVTLSGYRRDEPLPRIYRTTNAGQYWQDISGNLPDAPINVVVVDPENTTYLYVGTDVGVYYTYNLGEIWIPLGTGLPIVSVHDLVLHQPTRDLVAATHGRSMFRHDIETADVPEGALTSVGILRMQRPAPNPFSSRTVIRYRLESSSEVSAAVYDVMGREVFRWPGREQSSGDYSLSWDGRDASGNRVGSGIYWIRMRAGAEVRAAKVLLEQ